MTSKLAVALYLGESYATIGLFDISDKNAPATLFEKSTFLPQATLKSLLVQLKQHLPQSETPEAELPVYIVTKYFDRLRQFRLGGSISQVVVRGFENSYTVSDSKALSLAAAQLIISINPKEVTADYLASELMRIKKINPDLNKAVISLPENEVTSSDRDLITSFFTEAGLKIFICRNPNNQNLLRKTLLNAGSEGTKEEIISDVTETLGSQCRMYFYCNDSFEENFENCELFGSSGNFLSAFVKSQKHSSGAYFDIETLQISTLHLNANWKSPWGNIPLSHYAQIELGVHPFAEVRLNHLALLEIVPSLSQLEPGPVIAGRAIKPLMIDLFHRELRSNEFIKSLFPQLDQDNIASKINNLFSVMEKGQKNPALSLHISEFKSNILDAIVRQLQFHNPDKAPLVFGPLASIFGPEEARSRSPVFSWPMEIIKVALKERKSA